MKMGNLKLSVLSDMCMSLWYMMNMATNVICIGGCSVNVR